VGRARRGQYGGGDRRGGAVLRRRWKTRRAGQVHTQRDDRIRGARLRHYWASKGQAQAVGNKAAFLWQKFPKFVLGFLIISVLATYHFFNKDQVGALAIFRGGRFC